MAKGGGISGVAVAMATAGAFLVYIGIRDIPVLDGLREITLGKLPAPRNKAASTAAAAKQALYAGGGTGTAVQTGLTTGSTSSSLVAAALTHKDEKYSQLRRFQTGYSDCSSFVGKSLTDTGITPPAGSVTGSYLVWGQMTTIPRSQLAAGDICVNGGHMIIAMSNSTGIGQQNGRRNVVIGESVETMMPGAFICRRYTGPAASGKSAKSMAV